QSIPLAGGSFSDLYVGSLPSFSPGGIAVNGNTLYLTNGATIEQMPTSGGTPTVLVSDSRFANLHGIIYLKNALYVIDNHATFAEIWKVDLSAGVDQAPSVTAPPDQAAVEGAATSFNLGSISDADSSSWSVNINW